MTTAKNRKPWKPPPIEVGDRVKHLAKEAIGYVWKLKGTTATVLLEGEACVVDVKGLSYRPSPNKIRQQMKLIRRSHRSKSLRAELGLPKHIGVNDKYLMKEKKQ